jgi:hypothetical protein
MSDKPVYPFSQGQYFENLVYRTPNYVQEQRKGFINEALNLRNSKYFFVEDSVECLTLCDRPYTNYSAQKKRLRPSFCGYPINQKVSEKLFELTQPAGHWFPHYDQKIIELLVTIPLVPFRVIKNIKSLSGSGNVLPNGSYFSVGTVQGSENHEVLQSTGCTPTPFFEAIEVLGNATKMFQVFDSRWTADRFSVQNIFIPVKAFSAAEQVGLVLLPNGSVTWLWHDGKWKTVKVSTTFCSKGKNSFCTKFTEIDTNAQGILLEKTCLLEINGKEIEVHKRISKLLDQDELRIAFRSFSKITSNPRASHPRSQLLSMIAKNFKSEFLDPYKMNLLKSTEYKNMSSFSEFALALAEKSSPLLAVLLDKVHSDWLSEFAVAAAKDGTPLFWGVDTMLDNRWSSYLKQALIAAGFHPNSTGPVANMYGHYHFGVTAKDVKDGLQKKVSVSFSATVERPVIQRYTIEPKETQEVMVPEFVIRKGETAVKQYVANSLNENIHEYQLNNYKTTSEMTHQKTRSSEIKILVNLSSVKVNEIIHS